MRATHEAKHSAVRHSQQGAAERHSTSISETHGRFGGGDERGLVWEEVSNMKWWHGNKDTAGDDDIIPRNSYSLIILAPFPTHIKGNFQCVFGVSVCLPCKTAALFSKTLQEKVKRDAKKTNIH